MPTISRYLICLALGVVVFRTPTFADDAAQKKSLAKVKIVDVNKREPKKLKIGVTPSGKTPKAGNVGFDVWDDMGKLLKSLGDGYKYDDLIEKKVIDLHVDKKLKDYDILFLPCSPGIEIAKLKEPLADFVTNGGLVFASDWRYDTIALAFPDMVAQNARADGAAQDVEAEIVDPVLRDFLDSKKVTIRFRLPEWKPAAFGGPRVTTLVTGTFKKYKSKDQVSAPLMTEFRIGQGMVLFSSFHVENGLSRAEEQLLKGLIFRLLTSHAASDVSARNSMDGFAPFESKLVNVKAKQSLVKEFTVAQSGTVRISLGFPHENVKMRFSIKAPDGSEHTRECESTTMLEIADAAKGTWTWSVTPIDAPDNFPFSVVIAMKK
jgi:hypothetical protein